MGVFRRAARIIEIQVKDRITKEPDMQEQLQIAYQEMLSRVGEIKLVIGDVLSHLERLAHQITALEKEEQDLEDQATQALNDGDEEMAKEVLEKRRKRRQKRLELLNQQAILKKKLKYLQDAHDELKERVKDYQERRDELLADLSAATAAVWMQKTSALIERASQEGLDKLEAETRLAKAHEELLQDRDF